MFKNENIICISPIDWDFHWQAPQQIAFSLAEGDNNVLFIENTGVRPPSLRDIPRVKERIYNWRKSTKGFRQINERLYIFSPLIFPFTCSDFFRIINKFLFLTAVKRWCKITKFHNPIILTFLPTYVSLDLIDNLDSKLSIYYCADNYASVASNPKKLQRIESNIIRKVDLVFATIEGLKIHCEKYRKDVYLFPYGVDLSLFRSFKDKKIPIPHDLQTIPRPIVGFVGTIKRHMDFKLIKYIVEDNPDVSFVFIGGSELNLVKIKFGNRMYFLGKKDHKQIPYYVYNFDVNIIPYLINDYTRFVSPGKIYEYIYVGKPIISTALPSIIDIKKRYPESIDIAYNQEGFGILIKKLLKKKEISYDKLYLQREFSEEYSYEKMIPTMIGLIKNAIADKENVIQSDWKENVKYFYAAIRKKFVRFVLTAAFIYALIFYTPFIWSIGSFLKKADLPKRADAIIVFAGGVGESGKAGQGYEERVQYAVQLYRGGYAKKMIFSSGYMYALKEPLVMKALAIALGTPEEAIALEDEAKNTYENVKFTKRILDKEKWDEILLVSSPYHMRRVSLVFNKIAPNINVVYSPVTNSLFYSHSNKFFTKCTDLKQIKGIIHEYLGILYYWMRGWI